MKSYFSTRQTLSFITTCVVVTSGMKAYAQSDITPRPNWADSYSLNGKCYCATSFDHGIGEYMVDTPAGPKTVRQVCNAIGPGPGKGSNPVYNTVNCGHEPAHDDAIRINGRLVKDEKECPGRVDQGSAGCQVKGPTWDLSVFGGVPPSSQDQSCTVIADSPGASEALYAQQCGDFAMQDCDLITIDGQTKSVCSSRNISNDAAISIVGASTIIQSEDYARARDSDANNRGNEYRNGSVDIQTTGDNGGGFNVGWTANNEWLEYDIYLAESMDVVADFRLASTGDSGMFSISVDGDLRASNVSAPYTGNWQSYETRSSDLGTLGAGYHKLRMAISSGAFNINWLRLSGSSDTGAPAAAQINSNRSGDSVAVTVVPNVAISQVRQIDLYIDNSFIRTERVSPYTWNVDARTNDTKLQNLSSGTHQLRAVVIKNNASQSEASASFTID